MKSVVDAPILFSLARRMERSQIRGGSFLMRRLRNAGILDVIALYRLGSVMFGVPLSRLQWDFWDVVNYEKKLIDTFCRAIDLFDNAVLFDCGADIGTFSSLVCSRMGQISKVIAFEPNSVACQFLKANLDSLPIASELVPRAVGNFTGTGRLERPMYDSSDPARFLVPGEGPIEVAAIDSSIVRSGDVAIKLDIEGGELDALMGAANTIISARRCVISLEVHPLVGKRTGRDPVECLQFLESLRPFDFYIAETGERPSLSAGLLRSNQTEIWNVVGSAV